ncbi:MAG: L,D-transpeptidase [Myxococcales bacterium]|nr:L,D-transpeptidase [Polyangiaceae bacterium]MDW8247860.1 L,D-transpeptidase [Myxococcales bacterium]
MERSYPFRAQGSAVLLGVALGGLLLACSASSPPSPPPLPPPAVTAEEIAPVEAPLVLESGASGDGGEVAPTLTTEPARADTPAPADTRPRLGSIAWYTYIWEEPRRPKGTMPVGSVRIGTAVPLKQKEPVPGGDCRGKWYAVEPRGFICTDATTTFDLESPYFQALASVAPGEGPYPYRYAFSTGAPMYSRIPTPEEQERAELEFGPRYTFKTLGKWSEGHEWLVDKTGKIEATDEVPPFYRGNEPIPGSPWHPHLPKVRVIPAGSGFSYAKAFQHSGRVWLLTPELFLVPADRAFPYKKSDFKGVELGKGVELPLAWVRAHEGVAKFRRKAEGGFEEQQERWGKQVYVQLTGESVMEGKNVYLRTREDDTWIAEGPAISVVRQVEKLHMSIGEDEKWIEARLLPGTMTAYRGKKALWTTLWSAGKGGVPVPGKDPKKYATTELGVFPFQWKDKLSTMSPDRGAPTVFWFGDVPHIQYVKAPLAMHVAYWHDRFGYLMSAECLNVSASDGEWLFQFTDPPLPPGWGAIRPSKINGPSTRIHIKAN